MVAWQTCSEGKLDDSEKICQTILAANKNSVAALFVMGVIEARRQRNNKAVIWFRRCRNLQPNHIGAQINLGKLLLMQGQFQEALTCFQSAVEADPSHFAWRYFLGNTLMRLGRDEEAILAYRRALTLKPDFHDAALQLAFLLYGTHRLKEAKELSSVLVQQMPRNPLPRALLGHVFRAQGHIEDALSSYEEALQIAPSNREAIVGLAWIHIKANQLSEADRLLSLIAPSASENDNETLMARAELRARQSNYPAAIELLTRAFRSGTDYPLVFETLAYWHTLTNNWRAALDILEMGIKRHGGRSPSLLIFRFITQISIAEWRDYDSRLQEVLHLLHGQQSAELPPFNALLIPGLDTKDLLRINQAYAKRFKPGNRQSATARDTIISNDNRLKIGYLSADFHLHPTAFLTAGVFESHDTNAFETFGYSYGFRDTGTFGLRLESAFEHFVDIRALNPTEASQRIMDDSIDILVDLNGYTRHSRTEILALRPAPIQVNWLVYPSTMGAPFMDYIIADLNVAPVAEADAYQETLAYMPYTYAPVDLKSEVGPTPSRPESGLPATGFVFCCFNNTRKITPAFFNCWCRLLRAHPESVLWLLGDGDLVNNNLRREGKKRGVDPSRFIFVDRVSRPEHLARLALADLVLDTLPYNAHTTTADALFMGVPVLTCLGKTFPGRVAASLLRAVGLEDMITLDLDAYEARASHLASHSNEIVQLRQRLRNARTSQPYFDTPGFTRHLESLYHRMWQLHLLGRKPELLPFT